MARLAVTATMAIIPGRIGEVMKPIMTHRERCLRDEPRTLESEVPRP